MLSTLNILSLGQGNLLSNLSSEDAYYAHFAPPRKAPREWPLGRFLRWPALIWRRARSAR